jgi:hypothetical protein
MDDLQRGTTGSRRLRGKLNGRAWKDQHLWALVFWIRSQRNISYQSESYSGRHVLITDGRVKVQMQLEMQACKKPTLTTNSLIQAYLEKHLHEVSPQLKLPSECNTGKQYAQIPTVVQDWEKNCSEQYN